MSKPKGNENEEDDMARYSDKDKAKDQKQPAPRETVAAPVKPSGYGQVPAPAYPPVPAPIEAEDDEGGSDLRVVVFAGDTGEPAADSQPLADAKVTLTSGSFRQSQATNAEGESCWESLSPGEYLVEVASPNGYEPDTLRKEVALTEGEDAVLYFGLAAEGADLRLLAYSDAERCGDPAGQARIKNLRFEVFQDGVSLGSGKTGEDGVASLKLAAAGWAEVRTQGVVRAGGRSLLPAHGERQMVLLEPGKETEAQIGYVEGTAGLTVEALLVSDDDENESIPLPGVGLALYTQGSGVPVRTALSEDWPVPFVDLTPGTYTIAVTPPKSHCGHAVELVDAAQQRASVIVKAGSSSPLALRFRHARGRVEGCVRGLGSQEGWEGIRLRLVPLHGGGTLRAMTAARGEFVFHDVPAGAYQLELGEAKIHDGKGQWVLAPDSPARQRILVQPGAPVTAQPFLLIPDEHTLEVRVLDPDRRPLPFAAVEVLTEEGRPVGVFSTDEHGSRKIELDQAGNYQVRYKDDGTLFRTVQVNKGAFVELQTRSGGNGFGSRPGPSGPSEAVVDIPYPLLTESAMSAPSGWSSSAPTSADLGQTVQTALREVLNWRPSGFQGDAKGFVSALNQAFDIREIEGHTEFTWTPRSYAAVQTGLGALTGAQASIYTRAKVALDQALPLLEGLYPLRADADDQNVAAIRAIVRSAMTELVNELGIEGGPRVLRADDLLRQLTGYASSVQFNPNPEQVRGHLGQLAAVFGLQRGQVNTIDEEQNLTNFLIVADYMLGLQQSWLTQRGFFTRGNGSEPFLGTQLVLVERSLAVVAESVREVYMAMDSVFLGKEERQVVELRYPGEPSLFVAELLGWIDQVASNEGPQLIKEGGKQGVISFQPTIDRLAQLAAGALIPPQNPAELPAGYRTARVQRALQELADHLDETSTLVQQIQQRAA